MSDESECGSQLACHCIYLVFYKFFGSIHIVHLPEHFSLSWLGVKPVMV